MANDFTSNLPSTGIGEEIVRQSVDMGWDNFLCATCKNHSGGCKCDAGIFIAFEGANLSNCSYYQKGLKCPHCGKKVEG